MRRAAPDRFVDVETDVAILVEGERLPVLRHRHLGLDIGLLGAFARQIDDEILRERLRRLEQFGRGSGPAKCHCGPEAQARQGCPATVFTSARRVGLIPKTPSLAVANATSR